MTRPTAVAAPAPEPFADLFAVIDRLTMRELATFVRRVRLLAEARR